MTRYAIYFAPPPDSDFERSGAMALGRDARSGQDVPLAPVDGIDEDTLSALTDAPRRYGFHGTLKAPFRPADGVSEQDICSAVSEVAERCTPFDIPKMQIGILDGFVALLPAAPSVELMGLASRCVEDLDPLRAPMTDAEYARRKPEKLSQPQRQLLLRWGYPYVFDEFRFHMTLSERTSEDQAQRIARSREKLFAKVLSSPVVVDAVCVFKQAMPDQPFTNVARFRLGNPG